MAQCKDGQERLSPDTSKDERSVGKRNANARPVSLATRLKRAKRLGMDDRRTADYCGLTIKELRLFIKADPNLERLMRQANARGFGDVLKKLKDSKQCSAHIYVLEKHFGEEFKLRSADSIESETHMINAFREVSSKMTEDQLARAVEILELGRVTDNERKAAAGKGGESCTMTSQIQTPMPSPDPLPQCSVPEKSPAPNAISADSSVSPGTSSNLRRRS